MCAAAGTDDAGLLLAGANDMDGTRDDCSPGAGTAVEAGDFSAGDFAEEPDATVNARSDFATEDFAEGAFGEVSDATVDPCGDFDAGDFAAESDASVAPREDFAEGDFPGGSEGSADCDDEAPDPLSGVSA